MKNCRLLLFISIVLSCSCVHKRAVLLQLPESVIVNVKSFGAIENDGIDDSDAIRDAIEFALSLESLGSVVQFNAGVYNLSQPICIFNWNMHKETFDMISLTIRGPTPGYSLSQNIGRTTVIKKSYSGATIIVQRGRNCVVENITFLGNQDNLNDPASVLSSRNDLSNDLAFQYSPRASIVIDPFHSNVPLFARYKNLAEYYKNGSRGGSSMISIRGCSFIREELCIAVNPSDGVQNGENIVAEQCHVQRCNVFWASGQTQSRGNIIKNLYGYLINTFVDCTLIGKRNGTPPTMSNLNLAGFVNYFAKVDTRFSGFSVDQSYFESLWSLGIINANFVSFTQSQIKFEGYSSDFFAPPFHIRSNAICSFRDCSIEFFSNCREKSPLLFDAPSVLISGGWIESGLVVASGYYNTRGGSLHNVAFDNVYLKCQESIVNGARGPTSIQELNNSVLLGKSRKESLDGASYYNDGATFTDFYLGEIDLIVDTLRKKILFVSEYSESMKIGDCLFGLNKITFLEIGGKINSMRSYLGYISDIHNDSIFLSCIPEGTTSGKNMVYCVEYPVFTVPVWGSVSKGSNIVGSIISPLDLLPSIGTRIYHPSFDRPAIIKEHDRSKNELVLSEYSKYTGEIELISTDYLQNYRTKEGDISRVEFLRTNSKVTFRHNDGNDVEMYCSKGGIPRGSRLPVLVRSK